MYKLLIEEIPYISPDELFSKISSLPYPFLLESALCSGNNGYSFAGCEPYDIISIPVTATRDEILKTLNKLNSIKQLDLGHKPVPFIGGAVGFISYDLARFIEDLPDKLKDDLGLPCLSFALYGWIFAFDHNLNKTYIIASGFPEKKLHAYHTNAQKNMAYAKTCLKLASINKDSHVNREKTTQVKTMFTQDDYEKTIERTIEYIKAGDIFQVNISQRFELTDGPTPWQAYQKMLALNPAPFAAFLSYPEFAVVSASPERFIQKTGHAITTSPIKGTRKRGITAEEDELLKQDLWNSIKERAELAMIIDLERNDLNKFCLPGSVVVPRLYRLDQLPSVWHLASDIYGTVPENTPFSKVILSMFPGGSITGAPKIRAMEIIEELEKTKRGLYTGCIGYLGLDGDFDFNIVIRTAIFKEDKIYVQTGGGITALSEPNFEYIETLIKAQKIFEALGVKKNENFSI